MDKHDQRITRASHGVLVEVQRDRMGYLTVFPVTLDIQKTIRERSNTPDVLMHGYYIQHDGDCERFLDEDVSREAKRSILGGWPTKCYIYDELAWCMFGIEY